MPRAPVRNHCPKRCRFSLSPRAGIWWTAVLIAALLVTGTDIDQARSEQSQDRKVLGYPGFLVISVGRDSTAGFRWLEGPGPGRHSLVWPTGTLNIPLDLPVEDFSELDISIPCSGDMAGVGGGGNLLLRDGEYRISEPVLLSDGVIFLHLAAGRLEVMGERIRYFPPRQKSAPPDPKAGYIFLLGMVVLIAVLMRKARKKIKMRS